MRIFVAAVAAGLALSLHAPSAQGAGALPVAEAAVGSVGRIAYTWGEFTRTPDGYGGTEAKGIASRALDGSAVRMHSHAGEGNEVEPDWSPDGRWIVFTRIDGAESSVQVAPADGPARLLIPGAGFARFSPDGTRVVYARRGEGGGLFVAPVVDTGGEIRVDEAAARMIAPAPSMRASWHPSGTMLTYVRTTQDDSRYGELWRVNADGSGAVPMAPGLRALLLPEGGPAWSPTGAVVAFMATDGEGAPERVWVLDALGGVPRPARPGNSHDQAFSWHPSGLLLAIDTAAATSFALVSPAGELLRQVELQGIIHPEQPVFTPDGGSVLTVAQAEPGLGYDPQLYAVGLDGRVLRRLTDDNSVFPQSVRAMSPGLAQRLAGPDRLSTATSLARETFERASDVVLARADVYADGLVAGPLAGSLGAPLLLTDSGGLSDSVRTELRRLGAARAHIVGGTSAVSEQVAGELRAFGLEVQRVEGGDRFELSAAVSARLPGGHVFLVQGAAVDPERGWPDAVAVSGLAARLRRPILLTMADALPDATVRALRDGGVRAVTIVGGRAAVSQAVEDRLVSLGITVERVAGRTRYETSRAVAERARAEGMDATRPVLVTGRTWADSLAAGPAAAARGAVLLLVDGRDLASSPPAAEWIAAQAERSGFTGLTVVGGIAAMAPSTAVSMEHAALR